MIDTGELETLGYTIVPFEKRKWLDAIQQVAYSLFPCEPVRWHERETTSQEEHLEMARALNQAITEGDFVRKLVLDNLAPFEEVLGPDLDIQATPHVRVSRPDKEEDFVDWHRDYFYGNAPWELNLWLPLFPLEPGASLLFVEGSHVTPATNIRETTDSNEFRNTVEKGSVAHSLGYVYAPKIDDTVANLEQAKVRLLRPEFGSAVLFFGCGIHRAQNLSGVTRITVDTRIRDALAPSTTKPGYYRRLSRGVVARCVSKFLGTPD